MAREAIVESQIETATLTGNAAKADRGLEFYSRSIMSVEVPRKMLHSKRSFGKYPRGVESPAYDAYVLSRTDRIWH